MEVRSRLRATAALPEPLTLFPLGGNFGSTVVSFDLRQRSPYEKINLQVAQIICWNWLHCAKKKNSGRRPSDENAERVCASFLRSPQNSPDLTSMDFSFWGFVRDNVYIPPMPVDVQEFRDRIVNYIALVDVSSLNKLWDELQYRLDFCRITRSSHIEHLQKKKNSWVLHVVCNKLCCHVPIRFVTINFQICIPYSVTPCTSKCAVSNFTQRVWGLMSIHVSTEILFTVNRLISFFRTVC
jgi:hypothetical protein